jgi:hypothetical protein
VLCDVKTIREGNARVLTLLDGLAKSEDEKDQENSKPSIQNLVQSSKKVWVKTLAIANVF